MLSRMLSSTLIALALQLPLAAQTCGTWTSVDPPAGATLAVTDVQAVSADDAWAFATPLGLVRWDGAAWNQFPIADPFGSYPTVWIDAFALAGPSDLLLAGSGDTGPFSNDQVLKTWDGTDWSDWHSLTLQPNIQGAPRNGAARVVAAAGPDDAWILGSANAFGTGAGPPPLTVHWDGSELTEVLSPGIGDKQNDIFDAAVVASDDIWAVGEYFNVFSPPFNVHGAIWHWDGSSWSGVPSPADAFDSALYAVEAIAADDVWAAGFTGITPLFMHWDGADWSVVPAPATTGTIWGLAAIASDDVWAVDSPAQLPAVSKYYHWDGVAWSIVSPPDVPGATSISRHGGLAEVGPCDVWAVGSIDVGAGIDPFIERLQAPAGGPVVYCTAKTSSAGCSASIGTSSATLPTSGSADYSVTASQVQSSKTGLVFASISGPAALPFNGGTLCVQPPTKRGPISSSGGTGIDSCDGAFATLVNDGQPIPFGLDAGPGNTAWYQYWYRDPANGAGQLGTALSNAVRLSFQ